MWKGRIALALVMVLAACGGDDEGGGSTDAGSTTTKPTGTTILSEEGFPVYDVADRAEKRFDGVISPDWMIVTEDELWVQRDDGGIDVIDPDTNERVERVAPGGDHVCAGMGYSFESIWTCRGTDVLRIDPETGDVEATFAVNKAPLQGHLHAVADEVWVLVGDGSTLVGIDPETEDVATTIELGVRGAQVEAGDAGLWVVSTLDDQLLRIDPDAGAVDLRIESITAPTSASITDEVWIGSAFNTYRLDPDTGEVLVTSEIGTGGNGCVLRSDDGVWVREKDRFLVLLDAEDGTPIEGIVSEDTPSPGDTIVAFGSLWTSSYDHGTVFRIALI